MRAAIPTAFAFAVGAVYGTWSSPPWWGICIAVAGCLVTYVIADRWERHRRRDA